MAVYNKNDRGKEDENHDEREDLKCDLHSFVCYGNSEICIFHLYTYIIA